MSSQPAEFVWEKPGFWKREFYLKDGEAVLASLKWLKGTGTLAQGETAGEAWTFRRGGAFKTYLSVGQPGREAELGRVERKWNGQATLNLAGGPSFFWQKNKEWRGSWGFYDTTGRLLFSQKVSHGFGKQKGRVRLEPGAGELPEIKLLVLLGLYIEWLKYEEAAAAAAS